MKTRARSKNPAPLSFLRRMLCGCRPTNRQSGRKSQPDPAVYAQNLPLHSGTGGHHPGPRMHHAALGLGLFLEEFLPKSEHRQHRGRDDLKEGPKKGILLHNGKGSIAGKNILFPLRVGDSFPFLRLFGQSLWGRPFFPLLVRSPFRRGEGGGSPPRAPLPRLVFPNPFGDRFVLIPPPFLRAGAVAILQRPAPPARFPFEQRPFPFARLFPIRLLLARLPFPARLWGPRTVGVWLDLPVGFLPAFDFF